MNHNDIELTSEEKCAIHIFKKIEDKPSKKFSDKIKAMARQALQQHTEKLSSNIVLEGHFLLMAASDGALTAAVELIDKEKQTKLEVWIPRSSSEPYLVEIKPLQDHQDIFKKLQGSTIVIKVNNHEVYRGILKDDEFSEEISLKGIDRRQLSWSYHISTRPK